MEWRGGEVRGGEGRGWRESEGRGGERRGGEGWREEREQDKEKSQSGLEIKWQHVFYFITQRSGGPC